MFHEGRDYVWRMDHVVETPATAAAEWTFSYVVTDAVPRSAGRKVHFRGMSVFELEDARIRALPRILRHGRGAAQLGSRRTRSRRCYGAGSADAAALGVPRRLPRLRADRDGAEPRDGGGSGARWAGGATVVYGTVTVAAPIFLFLVGFVLPLRCTATRATS